MVLDTSALLALLLDEPDADAFRIAVEEARRAYRRFGRGRHAAGLNYGDTFAYALARVTDEPLLFKGDDFSRTDVKRVT